MNVGVARSDKLRALIGAIALTIGIAVLVPPVVEAAAQKVKTVKGSVTKVQGPVKIKDTANGVINSQRIGPQGTFGAKGSTGALDVRTFAGGNGFLGAGDCDGPAPPPTVTVPGNSIITGILITGTTNITVSADALPAVANPVLTFTTGAGNPNEAISLGNGLRASDNIDFNCTSGNGRYVIIGQSN